MESLVRIAHRNRQSILNRLARLCILKRFNLRPANRLRVNIGMYLATLVDEPFPGDDNEAEWHDLRTLLEEYLSDKDPTIQTANELIVVLNHRLTAIDRVQDVLDDMGLQEPSGKYFEDWHEARWLEAEEAHNPDVRAHYDSWKSLFADRGIPFYPHRGAPGGNFTRPLRYMAAAFAHNRIPLDQAGGEVAEMHLTELHWRMRRYRRVSRLRMRLEELPPWELEGHRPRWKVAVDAVRRRLKAQLEGVVQEDGDSPSKMSED